MSHYPRRAGTVSEDTMSYRRFSTTLLGCSLLLAPMLLRAQSTPSPAAVALAAQVDAHYNALHTLSVQFTQSYDGMGMHRVERGTLLLAKSTGLHVAPHAGKMRWTYTEPAGKLFVLDGKNAYFYTPGQDEVQRVPAAKLDDLRSPLALLLGHAELAKELTGLTLTPAADGDSTLSGVPHGLESRVARLSVTVTTAGIIHQLQVEELDGARNTFAFSNEQANPKVTPDAFVFATPPGTHIVAGMPPI